MKELVVRIYKDGSKVCGFIVEIEGNYVRIHERAFFTILNRLSNKAGLKVVMDEVIG